MSTFDHTADSDPQTRPNVDPGDAQDGDHQTALDGKQDKEDDPAHDTDADEGWTSEGGATPAGPATDTDDR